MYDDALLATISRRINPNILQLVFKDPDKPARSTWDVIKDTILRKQALPIVNQFMGIETAIELSMSHVVTRVEGGKTTSSTVTVFKVPSSKTQGRTIAAAYYTGSSMLNLIGMDYDGATFTGKPITITEAYKNAINTNISGSSSPNVDVNPPDILKVYADVTGMIDITLILGYDPDLFDFPNTAIPALGEYLAVLCKRHIVNDLELFLEKYTQSSGISSSKLQEIVENYKDESTEEIEWEKFHDLRTTDTMSRDTLAEFISAQI